ncbi:DHH family phosphoesterase [Haloarchaeobius amylolyticus]|uniref:DHH family phosphoesterase n=1 Tax=Haloarchaeobius amylolyticus TaxID=1198296 RepID=UPI0022714642|nr:DHH family phosphoesterase [Haloarchaeobius amylolyticus]
MVSRVVLGCGAVGQRLAEKLADWAGVQRVVCERQSRVEALREEGVDALGADPTDPDVLVDLADADVVIVASDDPHENRAIAAAARKRFEDALLVAYAGIGASTTDDAALSGLVDRVIDPETSFASVVADRVAGERAEDSLELRRVLESIDGKLAVVMHDNPDPDAIASAVALSRLSKAVGTPAEACYFGDISHQQNRAMVNLLDLDLRNLDPADDLGEFDGFALVDHSRPGVNDQLPEELHVDIVVDHHPPRGAIQGTYTDLRYDVGATSTLLTDHFYRFGVSLDKTVATALLYGIQIDTQEFSREVSTLDFEAAATLLPHVDEVVLERIESPSISGDTLDTMARAIENRQVRGSVLVTGAGRINDRDALPQAADKLLTMDGITTTLVYGFMEGMVYISARAQGTDIDLGETLRSAFNQIGSAGGHADMAGAQIPITQAFGEFETDEDRDEAIQEVIEERFFEATEQLPPSARRTRDRDRHLEFTYDGGIELPLPSSAPGSDGEEDESVREDGGLTVADE